MSRGKPSSFNLSRLILSLLLPFVAGAIGSVSTFSQITGWYTTLNKPAWNPPNEIFGPVWTFLYITIGLAIYYYWQTAEDKDRSRGLWVTIVQLALNSLWSIVFFGLHQPALALGVIFILWLMIVWNLIEFWNVKTGAGALLIPYLIWVSFASVLNYAVAILN